MDIVALRNITEKHNSAHNTCDVDKSGQNVENVVQILNYEVALTKVSQVICTNKIVHRHDFFLKKKVTKGGQFKSLYQLCLYLPYINSSVSNVEQILHTLIENMAPYSKFLYIFPCEHKICNLSNKVTDVKLTVSIYICFPF